MKNSKLIIDFSQALIDVSKKMDKIEDTIKGVKKISKIINTIPEFRYILSSKRIKKDVKKSIVVNSLQNHLGELELDLIAKLIDLNQLALIDSIINRFLIKVKNEGDIVRIQLESAKEFEDEALSSIKSKLQNLFNKKIQLDLNINKSLIGGIRIHIDNKIYDSSIITQLNKMKQSFIKR